MSNANITIEATDRTPQLQILFDQGQLKVKGESYPEDVATFYGPVIDAVHQRWRERLPAQGRGSGIDPGHLPVKPQVEGSSEGSPPTKIEDLPEDVLAKMQSTGQTGSR